MNIAILTTPDQWFIPYAEMLVSQIPNSQIFFSHEEICENHQWVFILSYHRTIPQKVLDKHQHNLVVHASTLPLGKGWTPLLWKAPKDKNIIIFSLFEAKEEIINGDIYMQKSLKLTGNERQEILREKQACMIQQICLEFIENYDHDKNHIQYPGVETTYNKHKAINSQLRPDESPKREFNLLRIVNNDLFPAIIKMDGNRYILKIEIDGFEESGYLVDFADFTEEEKVTVLDWRNHYSISQWMYQPEQITIEEHLNFINSLEFRTDKQYLMVKTQQSEIGVVDFVNIDFIQRSSNIGLYTNPELMMRGIGRKLLSISIIYAFMILELDTLNLEVFRSNERAIRLYEKFEFESTEYKIINGREVLCMQLKNQGKELIGRV